MHDKLTNKQLSTDTTTGETHVRHQMTKDGFYRGRRVIDVKVAVDTEA